MQTEHYGLYLTNDESTTFKEWREQINGPDDSNMVKIDAILNEKADRTELDQAVTDIEDKISEVEAERDRLLATKTDKETTDELSERITTAESEIEQNAAAIELRVTKDTLDTTLDGYVTDQEMEAAITIEAEKITASVEETNQTVSELTGEIEENYAKKSYVEQTADELRSEVTAADYVTGDEMSSAIKQSADEIATNVGQKYATQEELEEAEATLSDAVTGAQSAADQAQDEVDELEDRVLSAETSIKQNASAIELRATKTEVADVSSDVVEAMAVAEAARISADAATSEATKAQSAAKEADEKAAQAAADLVTAQENLSAVSSRVDSTEEEIAAAQEAVDRAQDAADQANAEAEAAHEAANIADAKAVEAKVVADNAQAEVDALETRVSTAETRIDQNAEAISLSATKEEVTTALSGYYTKTETDAAITLKSDSITSEVSKTYATKDSLNATNTSLSDLSSRVTQTESNIQSQVSAIDALGGRMTTVEQNATDFSIRIDKVETAASAAVVSTVEQFYKSNSHTTLTGGTWSTTQPTWTDGTYIWRRTLITYGDEATAFTPSENGVCITGNTGATGSAGKDGTDGADGRGVASVQNKYAVSSSNTTAPGTWYDTVQTMTATNKYLWNYEIIKYTDNTTSETAKRIIGVYGDTGESGSDGINGTDGRGISSITEYYLVSSDNTGVTTSTSGWKTAPSATDATNKYLWNYEVIKYTDNTSYTSTPAIIGTHGATGSDGKDGADGADGQDGQMLYATCSTAAATAAKVATLSSGSLSLKSGSSVAVRFTYANSVASPTLNVGGTGAKDIWVNGGAMTSADYYWVANAVVTFVYDGSYWVVADASALTKAAAANNAATEASKVATNFLSYSDNGLEIGNKQSGTWSGYRSRITSDAFEVISDDGAICSSFGVDRIELGNNSDSSIISFCNNNADISYKSDFVIGENDPISTVAISSDNLTLNSTVNCIGDSFYFYANKFVVYEDSIGVDGASPYWRKYTECNMGSSKISMRVLTVIADENGNTGGLAGNTRYGAQLVLDPYGVSIEPTPTSNSLTQGGVTLSLNGNPVLTTEDVETGTWTAKISNATISSQYCTYIRIGNMCTLSFMIEGTGSSSTTFGSSYYVKITGVPFTPSTSARWYGGGGHQQGLNIPSGNFFTGFIIEKDGEIFARTSTAATAGTGGYCCISNGGTSYYLSGTISYPII